MNLSVDIKGLGDCRNTLSQCERVIDRVRSSVSVERSSMSARVLRQSGADVQLREVIRRLQDDKESIQRMRTALSSIERRYSDMEKKATELSGGASMDESSGTGGYISGAPSAVWLDGTGIKGTDGPVEFDYDWKDFVGSFGNFGGLFGAVASLFTEKTFDVWAKSVLDISEKGFGFWKDYGNYNRIGRAIGTKNAMANFWKKQIGLSNVGYASKAKSPIARFRNNLTNTTSPFNLKKAFGSYVGNEGVGKTIASWAGVAITGVTNFLSNRDEQAKSGGNMSDGRVIAETVSETVIDTVATTVGTVAIGAAITAATGVVAAPALVAVATGAVIAGINAGVEHFTGKSATEWASDAILDGAKYVGDAVSKGFNSVSNWFKKKFA